ncbi:Fe-S cluster protein [Candidatus Aerophobetes bacterium]|nr:Fe-S cluster protein [Candidatus Aerophobetes bacterium]
MLLKELRKINTFFPPCRPGEVETVTATAELIGDISPAFPYLNAIFKGTIYNPEARTLSFRQEGRGVTLYPENMLVAGCKNPEEAKKVLGEVKDLINRTYEDKDTITPSYKTRAKLTALGIYKLLPRTNCGDCGQATCMAFASKLVTEEVSIDMCKPFFTDEYKKARESLLKVLKDAGYATPEL